MPFDQVIELLQRRILLSALYFQNLQEFCTLLLRVACILRKLRNKCSQCVQQHFQLGIRIGNFLMMRKLPIRMLIPLTSYNAWEHNVLLWALTTSKPSPIVHNTKYQAICPLQPFRSTESPILKLNDGAYPKVVSSAFTSHLKSSLYVLR